MVELSILHCFLKIKKMTTYEYILERREKKNSQAGQTPNVKPGSSNSNIKGSEAKEEIKSDKKFRGYGSYKPEYILCK